MEKMKLYDILSIFTTIKKEGKKIISNYYNNYQDREMLFDVYRGNHSIIFCVQDVKLYRVFFCSNAAEELSGLLSVLPLGSVADFITRKEEEFLWLLNSGFKQYAVFRRFGKEEDGSSYSNEPEWCKSLPERYRFDYAERKDAQSIYTLLYQVFDPKTNHLCTLDDLVNMIDKKWVLFYKEESEIISLLIYQVMGRKFYVNIIYNAGTADISYKIEQRALNDAKEQFDINYRYAWIDLKNKRALKRCGLKPENMYNYIFEKQ